MAGSVSLLCGPMQVPFCLDKGLPLDELSIMNYLKVLVLIIINFYRCSEVVARCGCW